eukprot:jgi/Tetstr1/460766/TSEL_005951.t1
MTDDSVIDLTLDDSSDDDAAQRPGKRSCPPAPEYSSSSDEVVVMEEVSGASPAVAVAGAGGLLLRGDEELRITGSRLEVWNQHLPHQRHLCGRHPFTRGASASNAQACGNVGPAAPRTALPLLVSAALWVC